MLALVDIRDVHIEGATSRFEYCCNLLHQLKNPYCFKVGDMTIKVEFSEDGAMFEEVLGRIIDRKIE